MFIDFNFNTKYSVRGQSLIFFENLLGEKMRIVDYWLSGSSKTLFDHRILVSGLDHPYFDAKHSILSQKFRFSKIHQCASYENGRGRFWDPSPWS